MWCEASLPKHITGRFLSTLSGVLMPMSRTFSDTPSASTTSVSPSTARSTVALASMASPGRPGAPDTSHPPSTATHNAATRSRLSTASVTALRRAG